ncbi:MAG: rod shape-determining protein [bacterium]
MFRKTIAIDFGSVKTVVVGEGGDILYQEPSIVAIDSISNKVIAIGEEAQKTIGKTPENIAVAYPIKEGVISSPRVAAAVLSYIISKISKKNRLFKPDLILSIPVGITSVERRAMYEAGMAAGAREVYLVPSLLCAALGSEMDINSAFGNTIISVGGGITEMGIMSLGGLVLSNSTRLAGISITESIITHIKKHHQLIIGFSMGEIVKTKIGNAIRVDEQLEVEVRGRDATTNMPKNIVLQTNDIIDAIKPTLMNIVVMIKQIMEKTPPELSSDLVDAGVMVAGGSAMLPNIASVFTKSIGVSFYVADNPALLVAEGLQLIIKQPELYTTYK